MSNTTDFVALKASIMALYQSGTFPHQVNPNALKTITSPSTGALGVGTAAAYTSGGVLGSTTFKDAAASFLVTTPVVAGDILRVPYSATYHVDHVIASVTNGTTLVLEKPLVNSVTSDLGYTILRKYADSPLDDIMAQIAAIETDLSLSGL